MQKLLYAAGTEFIRAFAVSVLLLATGILNAPNTQTAVALSIAAAGTSIAAGFRAVQVFVPAISFASFVAQPLAAWLDAFTRAAVAFGLVFAAGWLAAPDWANWKAALLGVLVGAGSAGARALQGLLTPGEQPTPAIGLK